ncbi:FAD-dependent monooxygenase [Nocardia sp. NBC_01327]|uniref:FAD-dependent monooxygenase n=1 Tax=Nocardia sp. NBC_01327 TaxID=2903593 RepID=UPI002E0FF8AC|nr:FAD-dependent monooxygenase [Nocardia sp. NBC_01327]
MTTQQQFTNKTVLISGASVAGPALAYWLQRYGFTVTVVEEAPALREGGYKVDIRGAAMQVIDRMGLLPEIGRASTAMRGGDWVDESGKTLATLGPDLIGLRGPGDDEVLRGDLARILFDATKTDVQYLFGDSILDLTEEADGVTVRFRHAAPRVFDLVIGADGMHSTVRRSIFGPEEQFAKHTGMAACVISVPNYLNLDHWELVHPTPGQIVQVYSTQQNTAKAQFIFGAPEQLPERGDIAAQQRVVAEAFADAGWETQNLLRLMAQSPDFYFDSVSQIHLERWSSGRAALVGDAAYSPSPLSGQGTSMALVGAYVLAAELNAAHGDHTVAFDAYQTRMSEYVNLNLTLGWTNAKQMVAADKRALKIHITAVRVMRRLPWKGMALRSIMKPLNHASNAIALEQYVPTTQHAA